MSELAQALLPSRPMESARLLGQEDSTEPSGGPTRKK